MDIKGIKNVLVTGGCGYIGSHVTRQLSEAGFNVVVLDDLSTGFRDALLHGEKLVIGSTGDQALVKKLIDEHQIDAILHFAASIVVPESVAEPVKYYTNNTANTLKLIDVASKSKLKGLVFSSTAAVYGTPQRTPVFESDPTEPESPYGWSKLMSERMLQDTAAATGLKFMILRYFNVAGAEPKQRLGHRTKDATHLIKVACEAATGKRPGMSIFGTDYPTADGTCIRDYIHIEDLADAHIKSLSYLANGGQSRILNCGYSRGSSNKQVIAAIKEISGVDFKVDYVARRPGDVMEVVAGATQIRNVLGWQPKFDDLKVIVEHAYKFEKLLK